MLSSRRIYRLGGFPLAALLRATCVGSINLHRHGPHHLESTDPRDKVFALLSLASDREDLRQQNVFPDYTKSCAEVYTSTMVALLQQGHWLLLSLCQTPKLQTDLPSWIPDWSRSATDMLQDVEDDHITICPVFSASGATSGDPCTTVTRENRCNPRLIVLSNIYDKIDAIGSFPGRASSNEVPLSDTFSWPQWWLLEILRLTYHNKRYHADFSDRLKAAARTSIGGVGWSQDAKLERVHDSRFVDAVTMITAGARHIIDDRMKSDLEQFLTERATKRTTENRFEAIKRLGSEINGKSLRRLPFVTEKGHLGLSAEHVQRGDVVAIIRGSQVAFVLREWAGGAYQLVGEAYVEGIMDGEAATSRYGAVILV